MDEIDFSTYSPGTLHKFLRDADYSKHHEAIRAELSRQETATGNPATCQPNPTAAGLTNVMSANGSVGHPGKKNQISATRTVAVSWPDALASEAFYGIVGDIVRTIEPHSEADPVALLVQSLIAFGSVVGRGPHFVAESARHFTNLFAVLVGATAKGRKGSSWSHISRLFSAVDEGWSQRVLSGLSTGEGLIWGVRDPIRQKQPVKERGKVVGYQDVEVDPGIGDKRLLVLESEFCSVLKVMGREKNTLSATIRQAWDTGTLRTLTKNSPATATDAHISIVGHITRDELRREITATEQTNGFANRFLWHCVRRSKPLPDGGNLQDCDLFPLIGRLRQAVEFARGVERMERDADAREIWHAIYPTLSEGGPGLLGGVLSRAEAQVMRLACLFALLDRSAVIRPEHLNAALAVWEHCEASAAYIFGRTFGDQTADAIMEALLINSSGMSRTEINGIFNGNTSAAEIERALSLLRETGRARVERIKTKGRAEERWYATPPHTKETK